MHGGKRKVSSRPAWVEMGPCLKRPHQTKRTKIEAGEMAQQLSSLAVLVEDGIQLSAPTVGASQLPLASATGELSPLSGL